MTIRSSLWPRTVPLIAAAGCGTLVIVNPVAGALAATAALAATLAVVYAPSLPYAFLRCAGVLLCGYALFGRGFAYLGAAPVFVGEGTLLVGLAAAAVGWGRGLRPAATVLWVLGAFMLLGLLRTVPFVPAYGVDALRDAVVWGYGLYAVVIAAALVHTGWLPNVPAQYQRFIQLFVWWVPFAWGLTAFRLESIPFAPGSTTPIISFKAGDAAVHLAGAAAFAFVGLTSWSAEAPTTRTRLLELAFWIGWAVSFGVTSSFNRGGMMAIFAASAVAVALGGRAAGARAARAVLVALALGAAFVALDAAGVAGAIRPPHEVRAISVDQLADNLSSVVTGKSDRAELDGTRQWRLAWWNTILGYTVHGPYFWTGKGFGVNLAKDDGFLVNDDESLRSPHNGHMSILARMGVPGIVLWGVLQLTYATSMLAAHLRARRAADVPSARLTAWLLAYWTAFLVNMSFDVYLEGPQGGIWLWSTIGIGLAFLAWQRRPAIATPTVASAR